jgi:peptidoglycan/LPS O-acetylase OafA/YrhL
MKGGFIGVDVFFVISGYLISSIIFESLDKGTFSFSSFYARRIKRIFPALILVLVACFVFGWFALLADEYKQLGKHIAAGAGFVSNIFLWNEAGYFDNAADTKPLLHLWSLGIEEQFYIVWPLLLWLAWKQKLNLVTTTIGIGIVSFALNLKGIKQDAIATFYSPQTRFWELLSGSLLAWVKLYKKDASLNLKDKIEIVLSRIVYNEKQEIGGKTLANALSFAGLFFLLYGFWRINKELSYPGNWALVPVIGTLLLLIAGSKAWVNRIILSNKVTVWFGLISYPLYLWHWPLLSFARIVESEVPSISMRLAALILSIILACLTYELIERPFRQGKYGEQKVTALLLLIFIVGVVGYNTYKRDGFLFRVKDRADFIEYFENSSPEWKFFKKQGIYAAYRTDCDFSSPESHKSLVSKINSSCYTKDPNKSHSVFIWGDSHAQQFYYGLNKNLPQDWQVLILASSGCPANIVLNDSNTNDCEKSNFVALESIKLAKPDVVLIAQNDSHNAAIGQAIKNKLIAHGVTKVVFVGPVPHWTAHLPKIIARKLWLFTPERTFIGVDKSYIVNNQKLKAEYFSNGLIYVDAISLFCNDRGCLTRIGKDRLSGITTHDYGHLLQISSDYIATNLLIKAIL